MITTGLCESCGAQAGNAARYITSDSRLTCALCAAKSPDSVRLSDVPKLLELARRAATYDQFPGGAGQEIRELLGRPKRIFGKDICIGVDFARGPGQAVHTWHFQDNVITQQPGPSWGNYSTGWSRVMAPGQAGKAERAAEEKRKARRAITGPDSERTSRRLIGMGYPPIPAWLRGAADDVDVYGACAAAWGVSRHLAKERLLGVYYNAGREAIERWSKDSLMVVRGKLDAMRDQLTRAFGFPCPVQVAVGRFAGFVPDTLRPHLTWTHEEKGRDPVRCELHTGDWDGLQGALRALPSGASLLGFRDFLTCQGRLQGYYLSNGR